MAQLEVYTGAEGEIKVGPAGSEVVVALITGLSLEVNPNIKGKRTMGNRGVQEWKLGSLEVSGTIEKLWYNHTFLGYVRPTGDILAEFQIITTLTGSDSVAKRATIKGVVFTSWSREKPEGDLVTESVDFEAKEIEWTP